MNFAPGWSPGFFGGGAAVLTSITQVLSATSSASTINFPSGIQAGDLIVLLDRAGSFNTSVTDVTPSGFTRVGNSLTLTDIGTFVQYRQNAWYKKATGSESGALTGLNGTTFNFKAMYVFRGDVAANTLTVGGAGEEITSNNPAAQNCAASGGVAPLVVIGCYGSTGTINPRTFSTTKDGEITPAVNLYLAYKIYNSAPANSSIDMDDEGAVNGLQSFYISMS